MNNRDAQAFYDEHYEVAADYPLVADQPIFLSDHTTLSERKCRYCTRSSPEVTFRARAHAASAFLGNRSLFSKNECFACNQGLADQYEDHLAKKLMFLRAVGQIRGRNRMPTYDSEKIRISTENGRLAITVTDPTLFQQYSQAEQVTFTETFSVPSQMHIPIRAAMALVKIACSTCPADDLPQVTPAIDWLMGRQNVLIPRFPVLYAYTSEVEPQSGYVKILRRVTNSANPYLWCVVATGSLRFQTFVPFCLSDDWIKSGKEASISCCHYPLSNEFEGTARSTEFHVFDWGGTEPVVDERSATLSIHESERIRNAHEQEGP